MFSVEWGHVQETSGEARKQWWRRLSCEGREERDIERKDKQESRKCQNGEMKRKQGRRTARDKTKNTKVLSSCPPSLPIVLSTLWGELRSFVFPEKIPAMSNRRNPNANNAGQHAAADNVGSQPGNDERGGVTRGKKERHRGSGFQEVNQESTHAAREVHLGGGK